MTLTMILVILAFIFFLLAGLGIGRAPLSLRDLGFAALTLTLLVR